jgi:hypothetical protein
VEVLAAAALVALGTVALWLIAPRLRRNGAFRFALIVSVAVTGLGLLALVAGIGMFVLMGGADIFD